MLWQTPFCMVRKVSEKIFRCNVHTDGYARTPVGAPARTRTHIPAPMHTYARIHTRMCTHAHKTHHMGNTTYVTSVMCNPLELLMHTHVYASLLPINLAMQFMHTCYANLAIVSLVVICQSEYIESDKTNRTRLRPSPSQRPKRSSPVEVARHST